MRKKQDSTRQMLSRYVPQLYSHAIHTIRDISYKDKFEKLMDVWETQKYFDDNCYKVSLLIILINYIN